MATAENLFNQHATDIDGVKKMSFQNLDCLDFFLQMSGMCSAPGLKGRIQELYSQWVWEENRSLSWSDIEAIVAAGEVKALIPRRIQQIQFVE
jgi:hypothetical protein